MTHIFPKNINRLYIDFQKRFATGLVTQKKTTSIKKWGKIIRRYFKNIDKLLADSKKIFAIRSIIQI